VLLYAFGFSEVIARSASDEAISCIFNRGLLTIILSSLILDITSLAGTNLAVKPRTSRKLSRFHLRSYHIRREQLAYEDE